MEKRKFRNTGLEVSLLGMGCMRLPKVDPDKDDIDYAHLVRGKGRRRGAHF